MLAWRRWWRTESWVGARGMTPLLDTTPTLGLNPTSEAVAAGLMMEPSVSVPSATRARFAATPTAEPELEPQGLCRTR